MNPTILLVDEFSAERENWKSFLKHHNFDVVSTDNEDSARFLCHSQLPDLVLLHHLPNVRGVDLCRRLKEDSLNQLTPVVLVSPPPTPEELQEGREAGAADFWNAPSSVVLCRIEALLRLKSLMDEEAKSVILSLAHSVESRHSRTEGHSDRLAEFAIQLGESLGLSGDELEQLHLGCLLHDIGKLAVPDFILLKPGPLNAEETEIVRQHPLTGERICAPLKCLRPVLPLIRHHHERMDGTGYPDGLVSNDIPLGARILQVADVYDALTSDRSYRKALSTNEALEILRQEAMYGWLDAKLVAKFCRLCPPPGPFSLKEHSMLASYYS
ncbi:MAG TPA: HD domain-containing phosphohydrolase [Candidatus Acidoferrum sp.]|nr:HD domain-containing phosphohydrolase [Candidatus Acidoferrum sp.]